MCPLRVLVIGAMLATVAPQAPGQSPALQPGDWVRYRIRPCSAASSLPAFCGTRDEASVTSVRPDSIHVTSRTEGTPVSIALHDMAHVERYAGRKSAFWRGAGIGAAIGAVGGIVVGSVVLEPSSCDGWASSSGRARLRNPSRPCRLKAWRASRASSCSVKTWRT